MTDDQLETLLRDTFRSREPLADPAVADEIARSVRPTRHRWPAYAAVAAAVVGIALVGALLVGDRTTEPPVTRPSPPPAPTATYQDNRAIALAEAKRLVRLVPLPDGAVETDGSTWPGGDGFGMAPSDNELRQVVVWTVPEDAADVGTHLRSHPMEGVDGGDEGSSSSGGGPTIPSISYTLPSAAPDAMMDTTVMVQWVQVGDHTVVRADAFTAARSVRSAASYVDGEVASVDIERVVRHYPRNQRLPDVHLAAPDDGADISTLVDSVNDLVGSIRPKQVVSCPGELAPTPMIRLTFHTSDGEMTFHLDDTCLNQVEVRRDGVLLRPTLDPGELGEAVESAVGRR